MFFFKLCKKRGVVHIYKCSMNISVCSLLCQDYFYMCAHGEWACTHHMLEASKERSVKQKSCKLLIKL